MNADKEKKENPYLSLKDPPLASKNVDDNF